MLAMCDRIRRARSRSGLSQTQLAERTGVKRSAVAQWEREGGTHPCVEHLARLAVITNVRFEWLATGRGTGLPEGDELAVSAVPEDYVRDELEGGILNLVRRLTPKKRQMAHDIIKMLVT